MTYLPAIAHDGESVLVVKQDDGATFLICAHLQPGLAEAYGGARATTQVPERPVGPFDPPTAAEVAEAMWGGDGEALWDA